MLPSELAHLLRRCTRETVREVAQQHIETHWALQQSFCKGARNARALRALAPLFSSAAFADLEAARRRNIERLQKRHKRRQHAAGTTRISGSGSTSSPQSIELPPLS